MATLRLFPPHQKASTMPQTVYLPLLAEQVDWGMPCTEV